MGRRMQIGQSYNVELRFCWTAHRSGAPRRSLCSLGGRQIALEQRGAQGDRQPEGHGARALQIPRWLDTVGAYEHDAQANVLLAVAQEKRATQFEWPLFIQIER